MSDSKEDELVAKQAPAAKPSSNGAAAANGHSKKKSRDDPFVVSDSDSEGKYKNKK